MCSFKNLHHSEKGYVVQCRKCAHFQIAFGSVAISLTHEQLNEFSETINDYYEANRFCVCNNQKTIRIPTALPSLVLALSVNDLKIIRDMIGEAYITLEIEKIFSFHEN